MARGRLVGIIASGVALLVGVGLLVFTGDGADEESLAVVRVNAGPVEVAAPGEVLAPVETTAVVSPGTRIRTGDDALAEIEYFDGSLSRIGPETTYEVVELERAPGRTVIVGELDIGETFHDVKELTGSESRFEVRESNAIAAVRGTRFAARCLPPQPCGIAVVEGVVVVTPSSGEPVPVEAGNRITIDDAGLLSDVTAITPDDAWINQNQYLG